MSESKSERQIVELETDEPVWDRCFTVAPLVLIGTRDEDGSLDLAPKHMAFPMGWKNYFGFVCSPRHQTCVNIERTGEFTVSYTKPSQVLYASLAASPRCEDGPKTVLQSFPTFPARKININPARPAYKPAISIPLPLICREWSRPPRNRPP